MPDDNPGQWPTVIPRIFVDDARGLVDFITEVFAATGEYFEARPTMLEIGNSVIMVSGSEARGEQTACLYIYVPDVDACFAAAMARGSTEVEAPLQTMYGDYRAIVTDRWGNMWQIASQQES